MEQHLQTLHGVVVTELVKGGGGPVLTESDVLHAGRIQNMDLVLLGDTSRGGLERPAARRRQRVTSRHLSFTEVTYVCTYVCT